MIAPEVATSDTFDAILSSSPEKLVVVEFWGPDCPNCEVFAAAEPELLAELGDLPVRFVKVNAYEDEALATRFGIYGIPTFFLWKGGRLLGRMTSFKGKRYWLDVIREHAVR